MQPSNSSFEYQFSITTQEFWDYQKLLTKPFHLSPLGSTKKNLMFWMFLFFFLSMLIVWAKYPILGKGVILGGISGIILTLGSFVWFTKHHQAFIRKNYAPMPHGIILSERKLVFTPRGVAQESNEIKGSFPWSIIEDIEESHSVILLKIDTFLGIPIPNRIFSTYTEKQEFLSSIREFWKQQHSRQKR